MTAPNEISKDRLEPNGISNLDESLLSFDDGTQTLTLAVNTGGGHDHFDYYIGGVKYTKTTDQTYTMTGGDLTTGMKFFYFDDGGDIKMSNTFDMQMISKWSFISELYWNNTQGKQIIMGDERHGIGMDAQTHAYLHLTRGAALESGGGLLDLYADDDPATDIRAVQLGAEATNMWDENILFDHDARSNTTLPIPKYYRLGS